MEKNLYQKIILARREFLEANVKKTGDNSFVKFKYFELKDILPIALPICEKVGICPVVSFENENAVMRVYDTESDKCVVITSPFTESPAKGMAPIQATGAVETYSRRYLWMSLLEIVENDVFESIQGSDDDKTGKPKSSAKKAQKNESIESMQRRIWATLVSCFGYKHDLDQKDKDEITSSARKFLQDRYSIKDASEINWEIEKDISAYIESSKKRS